MQDISRIPDATVYRLSLYHCYLGELIRSGESGSGLTSVILAERLGLGEATVRRDLSYIGAGGRAGVGYEWNALFDALTDFLGLHDEYPIIRIGSAQMLAALEVVFPPDAYGVRPVAYFSELEEDRGTVIGDLEVKHVREIPDLDPALGVQVALVACSQEWIDGVLALLNEGGVEGVLLMTPKVRLNRPEGMRIRHIRMPCDIKSLACGCRHLATV